MVFGLFGKSLLLAGVQRWVSISLGVVLIVGAVHLAQARVVETGDVAGQSIEIAHVGIASATLAGIRRRARFAEWIAAVRAGVCGRSGRDGDGPYYQWCDLHGGIRRRHAADDAGDRPWRKTRSAFVSIETARGDSGFRLSSRRAFDFTRDVAGHPLRQPEPCRGRFLLPSIISASSAGAHGHRGIFRRQPSAADATRDSNAVSAAPVAAAG